MLPYGLTNEVSRHASRLNSAEKRFHDQDDDLINQMMARKRIQEQAIKDEEARKIRQA